MVRLAVFAWFENSCEEDICHMLHMHISLRGDSLEPESLIINRYRELQKWFIIHSWVLEVIVLAIMHIDVDLTNMTGFVFGVFYS